MTPAEYRGESVSLRPMRAADLDFIAAAEWSDENRPFILPWSRARHLAALSSEDIAYFLIERAGTAVPVGFIM